MKNNYTKLYTDNPFSTQTKMFFHIDRVNEYMQTGDTKPIFMEVNLTNKCNMICRWCITEHFRNSEEIDIKYLMRFLVEIHLPMRLSGNDHFRIMIQRNMGQFMTLYFTIEKVTSRFLISNIQDWIKSILSPTIVRLMKKEKTIN